MTARKYLIAAAAPLLALLAAPLPVSAEPPARQTRFDVYGDEACPEPRSEDEIVVCARHPEDERYRIPRPFREQRDRPSETSWGARAMDLEEEQRSTRPNGCSVVGSWGQSGCTAAMVRDWYAERRARRRD